jgi:hypothetical protein
VEKLKTKEDNEDPLKSPEPLIKLNPKDGKIDRLVVKDDKGKISYEKIGNKNIIGVLIKPNEDKTKTSPDGSKIFKHLGFDVETQKCYSLKPEDSNKDIRIPVYDPRNNPSNFVPMENNNEINPSYMNRDWRAGVSGGDWRAGVSGGCAPCGQMIDPRFNPCNQPLDLQKCATISSRTLTIGNINYSQNA